jgi:dethiobiotin synthetase
MTMPRGLFVTGTDTGVGKTIVAVALLRSLAAAGIRAAGMKPVAAGAVADTGMNQDVVDLAAADGLDLPLADRNPYSFAPPIAPQLAARDVGVRIEPATIKAAWTRLADRADVIVVEGAGGVLVPLGPDFDMLGIPAMLGLPVLLVVGIRLGCINHGLLSALALRERGLRFAGWVANRIDPGMARADDTVADLASRLPAPRIADLSWGGPAAIGKETLATLDLVPGQRAGIHVD